MARKEEHTENATVTKVTKTVTKNKSPERQTQRESEETPKTRKPASPERAHSPQRPKERDMQTPVVNGHQQTSKDVPRTQRPASPEKTTSRTTPKLTRQPTPEKKQTPMKIATKPKGNKINQYASAYLKKVGLSESEKVKQLDSKKKIETNQKSVKHIEGYMTTEHVSTKSSTERTSSKNIIEHQEDKRSPSPLKSANLDRLPKEVSPVRRRSPSPDRQCPSVEDRRSPSPVERPNIEKRSPSPEKQKNVANRETIIKTTYNIEKKMPQKQVEEEKPSWITNRNLKKITSETRTFSSKKLDTEKPKYKISSPSNVITKPIDVITSSYGPGPLDADGKPLFGIKALKKGTNYQGNNSNSY